MSESNSSDSQAQGKPNKPYPDFPLFAHASKMWAKKIRGRTVYFGPWSDPDGALKKYLDQRDNLHAGRKPRVDTEAVTVKDIANAFLNAKEEKVSVGELSPRTQQDYKDACRLAVDHFGKNRLAADLTSDDFAALRNKLAKRYGPHRLGKTIQCIRMMFRYGRRKKLLETDVDFGDDFQKPSKKTMRLYRRKEGPKLFDAPEIRSMIDAASVQLKAMLLLGINAALGNSDIGNLRLDDLNLETGWLDYPRPKTGVARRAWLWPETVSAVKAALAERPEPKDDTDTRLVFITKYGYSWSKDIADSPITKELRKLLNKKEINGHRNFYTLRHTCRTVADETRDQAACDYVMGHESPHMSTLYREKIGDDRLQAVAEYVRQWLFGTTPAPTAVGTEERQSPDGRQV